MIERQRAGDGSPAAASFPRCEKTRDPVIGEEFDHVHFLSPSDPGISRFYPPRV